MKRLLICLIFQLTLFSTLEAISRDEGAIAIWYWQQLCGFPFMMHGLKRMCGRRPRRLWAHDRGLNRPEFFDQNLLGYFNTREFKARMRMDVSSFEYLCSTLSPLLYRQDTTHEGCHPCSS